jgi:hypothetical protein
MLLRRASQLIISDQIDVGSLGWWCVESVRASDDAQFIHLILSNRQHVLDSVAPAPVELRRMTVRRKDYLKVNIRHLLLPFESGR